MTHIWLRTTRSDRPVMIVADARVPDGDIIVQDTGGHVLCVITFSPTYNLLYGRDDVEAGDTVLRVNPDYARRQWAIARWRGETVGALQ